VLLLSRYGRLGASSRVRSYQYLPCLGDHGLVVTPAPLLGDQYIQRLYAGRRPELTSIVVHYANRLWDLATASRFHLLWIEYALFPWLPAWCEALLARLGVPYVADYDDPVFHRYNLTPNPLLRRVRGDTIDKVFLAASLIREGTDSLAAHARRAGTSPVEYMPTVIEASRDRAARA